VLASQGLFHVVAYTCYGHIRLSSMFYSSDCTRLGFHIKSYLSIYLCDLNYSFLSHTLELILLSTPKEPDVCY
jgi:hypothetical protein